MRSFLLLAVALAFVLPAFACREEGPLEKAGKQMDDAVDRIRYGDEGSMEKAGREMDEAIEESKEDWQERNR